MSGIIRERDKKEGRISSCGKVHSAENAKYRKFLLQLKQQENLMEKNLINSMDNMKLEPEVLRSVLHYMSDNARNRQAFMDNMKKSLEDITEELRSVKSIMNSPEKIQKLDTNTYKQRLVRLSQKIRDFKESCQLQTLSEEQATLETELRKFESNLHKYESATGSIGKRTSTASSNKENKSSHDYKKIQDFHALIAKTGHTDNWSDEDHLLFLKMRKKCSNIPALVTSIRVKCPDLTAETIVNHEAWYKIYLHLREEQRSNIKEWREKKEIEKMKKNREDETLKESPREKTSSNITNGLSIRITDRCNGKLTRTNRFVDVNANEKKELIRRWKMERENKRLIDEEQLKILIESKLAAQERHKRERMKRIQEALVDYRERKSREVSSETSKDNSGSKHNPILIKAFRKQDEKYMRRKKNLISRLRKPTESGTIKVEKSQITRKQNYSTLLNSTKAWREKCRMQDPNMKKPKKLQYIKDVPRLYVQWRNEESTEVKDILAFS